MRADPTADSLKDDPRFAELIEEAGPRVGSGLMSADAVRDGAVPSGAALARIYERTGSQPSARSSSVTYLAPPRS